MPPLRGEAARKTYVRHAEIAGGVWIAHHEILGQNCVQKTYAPAGREDAIAFAEPRLLNELDHPHITPLREAQFDPDRPGHVTIVMPVYAGGSVHAAMAAGQARFSTGAVVSVVADIADALAYLHSSKGFLHRDIKPKNVLLDAGRQAGYLADFGSAAVLDPTTGTTAAVRTTPLYQAPELGRTGRMGPPADVYGLAFTAFEMMNGLLEYNLLDPAATDRRINAGRRSLPDSAFASSAFAPHIPNTLRQLVQKALNANPDVRPSSAGLLRSLRALKCIDWQHTTGNGLEGLWEGRWPPSRRVEQQIQVRVTSSVLRAGRGRGQLRLEADYLSATSGGWRSTGVAPATVGAQDAAAVSTFFSAVDAHVANRWPT